MIRKQVSAPIASDTYELGVPDNLVMAISVAITKDKCLLDGYFTERHWWILKKINAHRVILVRPKPCK